MLTLRFDGLYRQIEGESAKNSRAGFMCYGWIIIKNSRIVAHGYGACASNHNASSNTAEYLALIDGLDALVDMGVRHELIMVMGDAKSVIEQMNGAAAVNAAASRTLYRRAKQLEREFSRLSWCWTPRQFNKAADLLTRRAMSQAQKDMQAFLDHSLAPALPKDRTAPIKGLQPLIDFRVYRPAGV